MDEVFTFEDREYVNPEVSLNEQLDFVDKYRTLQNQSQAQINRGTQALGTQVPSSMGGLTGAENLWTTQYRTPQVNATVENLKQAAQMSALNTALSNQQTMWQNRYNQAERAYQRAKMKRDYTSTSNSGANDNVKFKGADEYEKKGTITGGTPGTITLMMTNGKQGVWRMNPDGSQGEFLGTLENGKIVPTTNNAQSNGTTKMGGANRDAENAYMIASLANPITAPLALPTLFKRIFGGQ